MIINDEFIAYLKNIASEAGDILQKYFQSVNLQVNYKEDKTPVTEADLESNHFISEALKDGFPNFGLVTEENERDFKDYTWLVDPLDGTKHFARGDSNYHVLIGLLKDNKPVWGISYNPSKDVFFYGGKDFGSFREDIKGRKKLAIKPSKTTKLVIRHDKYAKSDMEKFGKVLNLAKVFGKNNPKYEYKHVFTFIACNEANLTFDNSEENTFGPWDLCAPQAILEGAGGVAKDYYGNDLDFSNKEHILSNGYCAADSLERINNLPWVHNVM